MSIAYHPDSQQSEQGSEQARSHVSCAFPASFPCPSRLLPAFFPCSFRVLPAFVPCSTRVNVLHKEVTTLFTRDNRKTNAGKEIPSMGQKGQECNISTLRSWRELRRARKRTVPLGGSTILQLPLSRQGDAITPIYSLTGVSIRYFSLTSLGNLALNLESLAPSLESLEQSGNGSGSQSGKSECGLESLMATRVHMVCR